MKTKTKLFPATLLLSAVLIAPAHAAVITDFGSFDQTGNLLSPGAGPVFNTREQEISVTTGINTNTITFANTDPVTGTGTGQTLFLTNSFSLSNVGDRISADFGSIGGTFTNGAQGIGLAIATSDAITARENIIFFYFRRGGNAMAPALQLDYLSFNGSGVFDNGVDVNVGNGNVDSIFIERTATGYQLSSILGGVTTERYTLAFGGNVTADGSFVGIYSDLRGNDQVNTINNFAFTPIPEPSTALLGGLGLLALLRSRRR